MKILLLGSNGVIGNGISLSFKKYKLIKVNSNSYDYNKDKYILNKFPKCDFFIHAAGITEEEIKKKGSKKSFKRASKATNQLLSHLAKSGCKNMIYISSLRLYSEKAITLKEEKTKLQIDDHYKLCHFRTENIFKKIAKKNKINFLILRPGAVYGFPKNKYKLNRLKLIPYSFPISLYKDDKILLKSSGNQMRSFCSNKDIGKRVYNWFKNKNKKSILSNISGDKTSSVKDFSFMCTKIFKKIFKKKGVVEIPSKFSKNLKNKKLVVKQKINIKNIDKLENFLKNFFQLLKKNKIILKELHN